MFRGAVIWVVILSLAVLTPIPEYLEVRDLGCMPYAEAFALQKSEQQTVIADRSARGRQVVLLVEHDPPVITVTRRKEAAAHVLASPEALAAAGVERCDTDRGGDVTYHGPGQLVVYPILDLNRLDLRLHGYLRWLEDRVLETLGHFGLRGQRDEKATGVWIGGDQPHRKIAAMGVRVSRWVSMHGLSLNVDPDLSHFDLIVPCGLHGRAVTSMAAELGEAPPMGHVKAVLADAILAAMARDMAAVESSPDV